MQSRDPYEVINSIPGHRQALPTIGARVIALKYEQANRTYEPALAIVQNDYNNGIVVRFCTVVENHIELGKTKYWLPSHWVFTSNDPWCGDHTQPYISIRTTTKDDITTWRGSVLVETTEYWKDYTDLITLDQVKADYESDQTSSFTAHQTIER